MVWIHAATAHLGGSNGSNNTSPLRTVDVSEFCIDQLEMTVSRYNACVRSSHCPPPDRSCQIHDDRYADDLPIRCITWNAAKEACAYEGKRLPTQDEWELAARGPTALRHPIGFDGTLTFAAAVHHFDRHPMGRVGEDYADDVAATGVRGMAGNVSEWTNDASDGSKAIVRGGSYLTHFMSFDADARVLATTEARPDVGIRCALTPTRQ